MKYIALYATIIVFSLVSLCELSAQNVPILIKGKTFDAETKTPIGTNFIIVSSEAKQIPVKSNKADGEYQQVLKSGQSYKVYFEGFHLQNNEFSIPNYNEYVEIEREFHLVPIKIGDVLYELSLFKKNDSTITENDRQTLIEIGKYLKLQKNIELEIRINAKDCTFKSKKVKVQKEGSKKPQTITISASEQAEMMIESRISKLKAAFKENGIRISGVNFVADKNMTKNDEKKSKNTKSKSQINIYNTFMTVSGMKNIK